MNQLPWFGRVLACAIGMAGLGFTASAQTATTAPKPKTAAGDSIKDNGDGTVTDKKTGLMWQKEVSRNYMTWPGAQKYCHGLLVAGHSDWMLPKKDQLVSLWSDGGFRSLDGFTWSSEIDPGMQVFGGSFAWIVQSKTGEISHAPASESNTNYLNSARCVRVAK